MELHGDTRTDDYYWLRERENPAVIAYLEAENTYTNSKMAMTVELQKTIFQEFKTRIKQTDDTVPYLKNGYFYYVRMEDGKEYPYYCRKKGSLEAEEEIFLDVNALAEGHDFYRVSGREVSPNGKLVVYGEDTAGRRLYSLRVKNIETGETLPVSIPHLGASFAWGNDNKTIFYVKKEEETLRWYRIYRHVLGTDPAQDELVFEEKDETFGCWVYNSKSQEYVLIESQQTLSAEILYLDADRPSGEFSIFQPRERDHEYSLDHIGDTFYIRTNWGAKNFRLMSAKIEDTSKEAWQEVIPAREGIFLSGFELLQDHLTVVERKDGLIQMRISDSDGKNPHYLDFGEATYTASLGDNYEAESSVLRYEYSSMTTPKSVYDYDMKTREKTLLKQDEVLGGFDRENYHAERLYAPAEDGTLVPISLVYRKGLERDGANPVLLYGYGSYGYSMNARFSPYRISLLDRGFIFAIAHIRGGQEMGRDWYDNGKLLDKKNTFTDFIACGEHLIKEDFTSPQDLYCMGGSAGGLLIGAVVNMRPDLFHGAIASVPFVDVITTMLDDDIPLTTSEFDEWGDPKDKEYYEYMLSYSPYDNVGAKNYPNLLVVTSLQDSQVQYWEPAKWVAKLRASKTDENLLLLKTYMEAGHGGRSGRDSQYEEISFEYAFLLELAGKSHTDMSKSGLE
jgi:oligopeptidase B